MNYEELDHEAQHLANTEEVDYNYDSDTLREIYDETNQEEETYEFEDEYMEEYARI